MILCSRRNGALLALTLTAAACSGGEAPEVAAPVATTIVQTTTIAPTTEAPTTTAAPATTTTAAEEAPATLAFASSRDLGRLYQVDASAGDVFAALEPDGEATLGPIGADTIVRAMSAKSRSGQLWVMVARADEADRAIGWVPASLLVETTAVIETSNADNSTQFRRVVGVRASSFLNVRAEANVESDAVGQLGADATFMHGGWTAIDSSGDTWIDILDASTGTRVGWVLGKFAKEVTGVEAQTAAGIDARRVADRDTSYGAAIGSAGLTATGCNAAQITISGDSTSQGTALLFGSAANPASDETQWTMSGGGELWIDPGDTIVLTLPSNAPATWYFLAVNADGDAVAQPSTTGGAAVVPTTVNELISFSIDQSYCGTPPPEPEPGQIDDQFILDLEDSGVDISELDVNTAPEVTDEGDATGDDEQAPADTEPPADTQPPAEDPGDSVP